MAFIKFLDTGKVQRVLTKDIGGGGLRFSTEAGLPVGTPLEVEMTLPDGDAPIRFTVEVVRSRLLEAQRGSARTPPPAETAVRIITIDPKAHRLLMQYATLNALP